ncbi:SNAP25 homologous protein SNAP33-like protein [Tanacetum coccineum]
MAMDMGSKIERHNKALNPLDDDVKELTIKVKGANQYKKEGKTMCTMRLPAQRMCKVATRGGCAMHEVGDRDFGSDVEELMLGVFVGGGVMWGVGIALWA